VSVGTNPATGTNYNYGQMGGQESVTLTQQQIPTHSHRALGSVDPATSNSPQNTVPASLTVASGQLPYGTDPPPTGLLPGAISPVGGSQPHENVQPFLVVSFIIALFGIFPSPS
jgi:microcystin-dependent protein